MLGLKQMDKNHLKGNETQEITKLRFIVIRKSFTRKIFQLDLLSPGAGFFPIGTIN